MKIILKIFLALSMASCGPKIIDRPVVFNELRKEMSLDYMKEHYGLEKAAPTIEPEMVVIHWTAIPTFKKSFSAFYAPELPASRTAISGASELNVSTHFLVDRDGSIYRLMPENLMGRHVIGLNHAAIGIENVGGTPETPLTKAQLEANAKLVRYLDRKHGIDYLLGHYEYRRFEDHQLWLEQDPGYRTEKVDPGGDFMRALRERLKALSLHALPKIDQDYEE